MNRKAQGMSINVVVIAAICLIVLVILVLIVVNSGKKITNTTGDKSCLAQGGTCRESCDYFENGVRIQEEFIPETNCAYPKGQCCRYNFGG